MDLHHLLTRLLVYLLKGVARALRLGMVSLGTLLTKSSPNIRLMDRMADKADHHGLLNVEGRMGIQLQASRMKRIRERFTRTRRTWGPEERVVVEDAVADEDADAHAERERILELVGRRLPRISISYLSS